MYKAAKGSFGKVSIGTPDLSKLSVSQYTASGVLTNPGISIFGASLQTGVVRAGVSIGPPLTIPGTTLPFSLEVSGVSQYFGVLNNFGTTNLFGLNTMFGGTIKNGFSIKNSIDIKNGLNVANAVSNFNGKLFANAGIVAPIVVAPKLIGKATGNKPLSAFDLPHWKDEGKRIRHLCAEGPEAGIYIRGRLKDSNVIQLPDYWDGLVDYDSITVQLQPIGDRHYHLNIMEMDEEKIVVKEADDKPFECFYHVWVARWIDPRNHDEKLHVVYDGESPDDYPGNPEQFLVGGWDYDRRKPNWK